MLLKCLHLHWVWKEIKQDAQRACAMRRFIETVNVK